MIPLNSYEGLTWRLDRICQASQRSCLVGILFADPAFELTKKEIIPFLHRFDVRSQSFTNFFFAGYVIQNEAPQYPDAFYVTDGPGGLQWQFSVEAFEKIRRDLESHTRWQYSGGVDLLLVDATRDRNKYSRMELCWDRSLPFDLSAARDSKRIPQLPQFFEPLFRKAESEHATPIMAVSDNALGPMCASVAKALVAHFTSKEAVAEFEKAQLFAVRDLAR
jgi:hypothetical protein